MIGKPLRWRHFGVATAIAGVSALAATGVIGSGSHPERFDAKTVVVAHDGFRRIRVTEYVDIDFGSQRRHGYERTIPNDFGVPADVTASSPDADDGLQVIDFGDETRIRIGEPDRTFTGQHRYELSYTLPDVDYRSQDGEPDLIVDIVAPARGRSTGDQETERFEVIVTGFELSDLRCHVGAEGDEGGCELNPIGDGTYRAVLEPLPAGAGLTVGGTIVRLAERVSIDTPPIPERREGSHPLLIAFWVALLGVAGSVPVYWWARRRGRNEVFAGGAVAAVFGSLPPPGSSGAAPSVALVDDEDMADLATIEFSPPQGVEPWEASVLVFEDIGDHTVEAWLSGLVGREAIVVEARDDDLAISSGPKRGDLPEADAALLDRILALGDPYVTGQYDESFAAVWDDVAEWQRRRIVTSGWWKRLPPGTLLWRAGIGPKMAATFFVLTPVFVGALLGAQTLFRHWLAVLPLAFGVPALTALFMYRVLLPVRSATGSALALRTEAFRRFLHASEGHHVEWAWTHGLVREYSAWAIALGEADAWSDALARANVPEPARASATPFVVRSHLGSVTKTRLSPAERSGGGGFGGGGVGGGGGGGSSGSW